MNKIHPVFAHRIKSMFNFSISYVRSIRDETANRIRPQGPENIDITHMPFLYAIALPNVGCKKAATKFKAKRQKNVDTRCIFLDKCAVRKVWELSYQNRQGAEMIQSAKRGKTCMKVRRGEQRKRSGRNIDC